MARITKRRYDEMVRAAARKIKPGQTIGYRMGGEPASESEHFYMCKKCGQAVDKRDLGQVFHHEVPNHHPLVDSPFNATRVIRPGSRLESSRKGFRGYNGAHHATRFGHKIWSV